MVDGTGMCGCCRITVGGEMKFACVDGPDFDAFEVDFDEAMNRGRNYQQEEREHICRLTGCLLYTSVPIFHKNSAYIIAFFF